jgi:hypothetical protein
VQVFVVIGFDAWIVWFAGQDEALAVFARIVRPVVVWNHLDAQFQFCNTNDTVSSLNTLSNDKVRWLASARKNSPLPAYDTVSQIMRTIAHIL